MTQQPLWHFPDPSESQPAVASGHTGRLDKDALSGDTKACKSRSPPPTLSYSSAEICILLAATTTHPAPDTSLLSCCHSVPLRMVQLLRAITWRYRALCKQVTPTGTINFHPLKQEAYAPEACGLCGSLLMQERGEQFRCTLCRIAVRLVLGYYPLAFWLRGAGNYTDGASSYDHKPQEQEVQEVRVLEPRDESEEDDET